MVKPIYLEEIISRAGLRTFLDHVRKLTGLTVNAFNEKGEPLFAGFTEAMQCPKPMCTGCPVRDIAALTQANGLFKCADGRRFKVHSLTSRGDVFGALIIGPFEIGTPSAPTAANPRPTVSEEQLQAATDLLDQFFGTQLEMASERINVHRKERILSVLEEASKIMNSTLDFQNLLEFLMDIAIEITGATCGACLLKKEGKNYLEVAVARGSHPQEVKKIRVPIGKGVTGWVARHLEPLVVPNVLLEPRYIETPETIYSEMAVPLLVGEKLIGVIAVDSNQVNAFSKDDATTLTMLASMVTKVVENARLLASSNQKLKELSHLFAISEKLADDQDGPGLLAEILNETVAAVSCEAAALLTRDPEADELRVRAGYHLPDDTRSVVIPMGKGLHGWVAKQRQLLNVAEVNRDQALSQFSPLDQFVRTALILPLMTSERSFGVLAVYQKQGKDGFSKDDQHLLTTIGRQLTAHFDNRRLFDDSQQRLAHLTTLYEVSDCVSQTLNPVRLFNMILKLVAKVVDVETSSLMLYDPVRQYLTLDAALGIPEAFIGEVKVPVGECISGWVARHKQPLLIRDLGKDERFAGNSRTDYKTGSALSIPIMHNERLLGVLNVNNKRSGALFNQDDLKLLTGISDQIAQGIFNAMLYEKTEQQVAELSLLQELGKAINSTLDLDSVLNYVIDMTTRITEADKSTLMLLDRDSKTLYVQVARGFEGNNVKDIRMTVGQGVAGKAAEMRRPLRVVNTAEDNSYIVLPGGDGEPRTLISAPMLNRDQLIGVINCERVLGRKVPFTQENLDILDTLASQASVAIENARLYHNLLNVYLETIRALAAAIDAKDSYTHGHSKRVTEISVALAQVMGCHRDEIDMIRHAALLHDVGKIGIAENILLKPGRLTDEEFEKIKDHPMIGAGILGSIEFLKVVCDVIEHHHERFDGKGYPDRLKADEIPLGSRIICVADSFDAITSSRPYRQPLSFDEAEREIERCGGSQFDPRVVAAFIKLRSSPHCPLWLVRKPTLGEQSVPAASSGRAAHS